MRATSFVRCLRDRGGATAVEYGLIVSILVVGLLAAFQRFQNANDSVYEKVEEQMIDAHS